jgi:Ca2+-transporting ATPase
VLTELERSAWTDRVRGLAETGHKVIGCASRELAEDRWLRDEPHEGYRLAGLIACEDPVRDGVVDAVAQARDAGIRVIMITGDHLATAIAVAREAGICGASPNAIEGAQLAGLVAEERGEALARVDVIARALPAQKVALVRALQARGDVVAVTGDGVNDVPALQAADIGIAMGERGTRSAREVGAIVLLDDNFRTIVSAIAEGRQLFRNLRLCFAYLLTIHLPLVATATLIPLASYPLLYLPVHIVWLELIIHPAALLAFQEFPAHAQPFGLRHDGRFFGVREWALVGGVGVVLTALIVWGYERSLAGGSTVEHARAMALVTLVLASAALTAGLSGLRTRGARIVTAATAASALLLVQAPVLARALHLEPLHAGDWAIAALSGVLPGLLGGVLRTRSRGVKRGAA